MYIESESRLVLEVTDDVIPNAEHVLVFSAVDDFVITDNTYEQLLQYPVLWHARFTTDGTAYRYDRTNGVTEYWIEPIAVELIEAQP